MQGQDQGSDHWLDDGLLDLNFLGDTVAHIDRTREWRRQENHPLVPTGQTLPQSLDDWRCFGPGDSRVDVPSSSSGENNVQYRAEFSGEDAENGSYIIIPSADDLQEEFKSVDTRSKLFDSKQGTSKSQQFSNANPWQVLQDEDDIIDEIGFHPQPNFDIIYTHDHGVDARSKSPFSDFAGGELNRKFMSAKEKDFDQRRSFSLEEWDVEMISHSEGTSFVSGFDEESRFDSDALSNMSKSMEDISQNFALQEYYTGGKREVVDKLDQTTSYAGDWSDGLKSISPRCKSADSKLSALPPFSFYDDSGPSFSTPLTNSEGDYLNSGWWNYGSNVLKSQPGTFSQGEFSGNLSSREGVGKEDYTLNYFCDRVQRDPPSLDVANSFNNLDEKSSRRSRHQSLPERGLANPLWNPGPLSMISNVNEHCSFDKYPILPTSDELSMFALNLDKTNTQSNGDRGQRNASVGAISPFTIVGPIHERDDSHGAFNCTSTATNIPPNPCHVNTVAVGATEGHSMPDGLTTLPLAKFKPGTNYANAPVRNDTSHLDVYDRTECADSQTWLDNKLYEARSLEKTLAIPKKATGPSSANPGFDQINHPNTSSAPFSRDSSNLKNLLKNSRAEIKREENPPQELLESLPSPHIELPSTSDATPVTPQPSPEDHEPNQGPETQGPQPRLHCASLKSEDMLGIHGDEEMEEALHKSKQTGTMTPLIMLELNRKIKYKRCMQGKGDIKEDSSSKPVFELTEEEKVKKKRRLERNRMAASKCRKRKLAKKQEFEQELKDEEERNAWLKEEITRLTARKNHFLFQLGTRGVFLATSHI